jgi:hypothetical protein
MDYKEVSLKRFFCVLFLFFIPILPLVFSTPHIGDTPNPCAEFEGFEDEDLSDVMVPIPMKDRVYNKSGIQCVFATTECLGRYAEEPKLINLTDSPDCQSYSGPGDLAMKLRRRGVKFEQTTSYNDRHLIIKAVVEERRGCLFDIPGHAMTLVHYDEKAGIVKYINNSDRKLAIRTWTMDEFNRHFQGWVCVIYADNDIVPTKYGPPPLPIIDRNGPIGIYAKDYIFLPKRR